jgi:hypothetical protein
MLLEAGLPAKKVFAFLVLVLATALAAGAAPKDGDSASAEISTAVAASDSPQQAAAAPGQSLAASRFSLAAELNRRLPWWLRFDAEYRARLEDGNTSGKLFTANGQDTYFLNRIRIGVTITPTSWLKFHLEGQDVRSFDKNPPRSFAFYDLYDLRQGYVEIGDTEKGTVALRAGRQVFNLTPFASPCAMAAIASTPLPRPSCRFCPSPLPASASPVPATTSTACMAASKSSFPRR